ncbi:hypothetical protein KI743_14765 [Vibrio sp. D420a]|uniref:hypothetical protein n=1 Tax=Vibrio sp. D420a TaxID=2836895 RepID=UPI00255704D3|nr:hypothetical protein [Vibrio sp. D420a]MDK9763265.1 hypothetical protein [Vibrio sp. D420a]
MSQENEELRRRLKILQDKLESGMLKISPHVYAQLESSFAAMRYDANGNIDPDSVDSSIRSMANGITMFHDREENKKAIPLAEIQRAYFGFINANFAPFYEMMKEAGKNPNDIARFFSQKTVTRNELVQSIPPFLEHIRELWDSCGDVAWTHLEDMDCLKLSHAGDLFPSYSHNVASKCGIYSDTIVLPDPFIRTLDLYQMWDDEQKVYYFLKHALSVLAYKDLALAELTTPIVVVLPEPQYLEEHERSFVEKLSERDGLKLAGNTFGREFESLDDAKEFFAALDSKNKVFNEVRDESKILADLDIGNNIKEQLDELCNNPLSIMNSLTPGQMILTNFLGRMGQANDALLKSRRVRGVPLIDAPTSWRYFNWKLQLDGEQLEQSSQEQLHVTHALTSLDGTELSWLGNIPPKSLIEIRKQGALEEIRSIMSKNISNLIESSPNKFGETSYQVYKNFQNAFEEHNTKVKELRTKKWKFGGFDIGSMVCTGAIELAAVATGSPLFGAVSWTAGQLLDTPKLREIPQKYRELMEEDKELSNSPVGLLVQCKQ